MTIQRYDEISQDLLSEALSIANGKRPGYTLGSIDVLRNFKSVADRMGITPMQAWGVYCLKHMDAICSVAKDPKIPQAEPIKGRFADAINYLLLGYSLLNEEVK